MAAGESAGRMAWAARLSPWLQAATRTEFRRNTLWVTLLSAFERLIAMAQTVVISRALGMTEYGVYGLLFGTIGFVASVVGFQMGLTATVFVSRYREAEKAKAAGVISTVSRFALISATVLVATSLPFSARLSEFLVGFGDYQLAVIVGIVFVAVTIVSGVQDGVAQGLERFRDLAKLKIGASLVVLVAIQPAAQAFGLDGVLIAILAGLVLKWVILERMIRRSRREAEIPDAAAAVSLRTLIGDFALPSMVVSLLVGFATWLGLFVLSKQDGGFNHVAIVSTGLQWRGPILLLAASIGSVAVPVFGRLSASGDASGLRQLRRRLILANMGVSLVAALAIVASSGLILALYGGNFAQGRLAFCVIALSTVPTVIVNVYMQELVGAARMWRQLWVHCPYLVALCVAFVWLVPRYHSMGYAAALLIGAVVFLAQALVADAMFSRRQTADSEARW